MTEHPPGWHPDPRGRHEHRYWDGTTWTDHVADQGNTALDPFDVAEAAAPVGPSLVNIPAIDPKDVQVSAAPAESAAAAASQPTPAEPAGIVQEPIVAPTAPEPAAQPRPASGGAAVGSPAATALGALGGIETPLAWRLVAIGGGLLVISLFMPWYTIDIGPVSDSLNGFQSLDLIDLLLLIAGLGGLVAGVMVLTGRGAQLPPQAPQVIAGLASLGLVLVIYRIIVIPFDTDIPEAPGFEVDSGRSFGLLVAFAASAALAAGAAAIATRQQR